MAGWVLILSAFVSRGIDVYDAFMCLMPLTEQVEIGKCNRLFFTFGAIFYHIHVASNKD
jgi:hypothetical protein